MVRAILCAALVLLTSLPAYAADMPHYGLSMFGDLKYPAGFQHFDYVNADAPVGGTLKQAWPSTFDSLNPFLLKGVKAPGLALLFESLMTQSLDEPYSMYGLIAESVTVAKDRSWAEFTMRPEAQWSDGTPITPEDVVFSLEILKTKADPAYRINYAQITKAEKTGPHSVKFTFSDTTMRELPMIAAAMPIMSKTYYSKVDFEKTTLTAPLSSGPYAVERVDQGRSMTYQRRKDYWGWKLPVNRGIYNYEKLRYDIYLDETVALEAIKAGEYDFREENVARNWATAYDTAAFKDGRMIKRLIPHSVPQGMQCFMFNLRLPKFSDPRVREAIGLSFDFEWLNKTIFFGVYQRNTSYFQNTEFAAADLPDAEEMKLLEPYRADLPPRLFTEPFALPKTDGSGNNRANLLKAQALLEEAGWIIKDGQRVNAKTGEVLTLEFLIRQPSMERIIAPMRKGLKRLGIEATIRNVDDSQYQKRVEQRDFDIMLPWINRGLFYPGQEQVAMWQSSQADIAGSNNESGMKNKVVDAMLAKVVGAEDKPSLIAAGRALDRVLLWQYAIIPHYHISAFRAIYRNRFGMPKVAPLYDVGLMTWWIDKEKDAALKR